VNEPTPPTDAELHQIAARNAKSPDDWTQRYRALFQAGRASVTEPKPETCGYCGRIDVCAINCPTNRQPVIELKPDPAARFSPEDRATLIEFAADRIQSVWNDVGETDAMTLAQNVVAAQEFAWLSMHFPIQRPKPDPEPIWARDDSEVCGERSPIYGMVCEKRKGHASRHRERYVGTWPNASGSVEMPKLDPEVARLRAVIAEIQDASDARSDWPEFGMRVQAILAAASADQPATREDEPFVDPCFGREKVGRDWHANLVLHAGDAEWHKPRTRAEYEADQEADR
jgi:hypothetical protein